MVIAWPLRLSSQGMIVGFLGAPKRPIVEAIGMPINMWVAWISPFDSESRMAAQLAPLMIVELIPYFLNSPFSWAITIGEQSVSAIMPKRKSAVSGLLASPISVGMPLATGVGLGAGLAFDLLQLGSAASAAKVAPSRMKSRRV